MRILHLIPGMEYSSGPTQALVSLASHQAKLGHEVTVGRLVGRVVEGPAFVRPEVIQKSFPVCCLKYWGYSPALRRFLRSHVSDYQVVHLHSIWLYTNFAAARACWMHGVPYLIRPAGSLEPWCLNYRQLKKAVYFRLVESKQLNRAAAVHAVSEQEAEGIRGAGVRAPVVVIPNGIDLAEFDDLPNREAARRQLGLPPDAPIILFLGRIHPKKGLDKLGEVFCRLAKTVPSAHLAVAGPDRDNPYADQIKQRYRELGISGSTTFLGEMKGAERVAAFAAANLFVLPSHSENFGIAVAESLAAGVPVVVSRNTPWKEVEEVGAGFWLDLDVEQWTDSITALLRDSSRARAMGLRGRELIQRKYSWAAISKRTIELYERLASGLPPGEAKLI